MTTLPPLANIFAFTDPDPVVVDRVEASLRADRRFHTVRRPVDGWVAAAAPLPGRVAEHVRDDGLVFARGMPPNKRPFEPVAIRTATGVQPALADLPEDPTVLHLRPHGCATARRSAGGPLPLYVAVDGERKAVSTLLGDMLRHLPDAPSADRLVQAAWTTRTGPFPDRRTPLAGVQVVPRGHALVLDAGSPRLVRHWDPRREELDPVDALAEHAAMLRSRLLAVLESELDGDGGNLLTLSGGVDSSALAVLAAEVVGVPLASLTFMPPWEEFWERVFPVVASLVARYRIEPAWIFELSRPRRVELFATAPPAAVPVVHPALQVLPDVGSGIHVLFGGELADQICGSALTWPDWLVHTSMRDVLRLPAARLPHGAHKDRLRWVRDQWRMGRGWRPLPYADDLSPVFRDELREEYREWLGRRRRRFDDDRLARPYLAVQLEDDGWAAMNWEACSELGIRRSTPFLDKEILDLAFRCHPHELIWSGTKRLLRTALDEDVPAEYLHREGKGQAVPSGPLPPPGSGPPLGELEDLVGGVDVHVEQDAVVLAMLGASARGLARIRAGRSMPVRQTM